jgi:MerR family transcriptional regulator, light-induced transcriptional regulator
VSIANPDQTQPAGHHDAPMLVPIGDVVAELQRTYPDVTHSSLRFLEREGLVIPSRTPGGHRLYSQQDLGRIRQIKTWQAERLSLEEIRGRLAAQHELGAPHAIADQFLEAAVRGDLASAAQVILDADDLGMPLARMFAEVLRPALYEVGIRWERGDLPVGQEKEISELARDLIAELSRRHTDPDPHGPVIVAACVAGERHDLGLRMVVGLLRARSRRVHFLGADVDPQFLQERVQQWRPAVVLLSATRTERLPDVASAVQAVRAVSGATDMPVVVGGGQLVHAQAEAIRALGAVPALDDGLETVLESEPGQGQDMADRSAAPPAATPPRAPR